MQPLFTVRHFYRGFPSTIIPSTAVSLSIYFPSRGYPAHYVPSPAGFPAGYRGNTVGKFPRRSLVRKMTGKIISTVLQCCTPCAIKRSQLIFVSILVKN